MVGDAAHLATPMLSQGCSQALEDALELGRAIGEAAPGAGAMLGPAWEGQVRLQRCRRAARAGPARQALRCCALRPGQHATQLLHREGGQPALARPACSLPGTQTA